MEDFRLKVFRAVAERLSFTKAAAALHLTQPAVTLQVKKLEQDLGLRLFDRTGGRVSLTPGGRVLLGYATRIEELYEAARREIGDLAGERRGTLRLGASTTNAQYILPYLLAAFVSRNPNAKFSVLSGNTGSVVTWLAEEKIELGLIEGPAGRADVRVERFLEDEIVLIVPVDHEWAGRDRRPVTLQALTASPLIFRERGSGTRVVVEEALSAAGADLEALRVVMELDSTEAIKTAVEAGLGAGMVSRWAIQNSTGLREVRVEGLRIRRDMQFVYPQGPEMAGLGGAFIRFVRENAAELLPEAG